MNAFKEKQERWKEAKKVDLNKRYTPQTWPDHPETATLEGKNKFVGFWLLLAAETVTFASLFATYLALKDKGPSLSLIHI